MTFEWWHGDKGLAIHVSAIEDVSYLKNWGPDMVDDMEVGPVTTSEERRELWAWFLRPATTRRKSEVLAGEAVVVPIEVVRVGRVGVERSLRFSLGREVLTIKVIVLGHRRSAQHQSQHHAHRRQQQQFPQGFSLGSFSLR